MRIEDIAFRDSYDCISLTAITLIFAFVTILIHRLSSECRRPYCLHDGGCNLTALRVDSIILTYLTENVIISFLQTRGGAIFRLGKPYVPEGAEMMSWQNEMTDTQRLSVLLSGKYPVFLMELLLLVAACTYFGVLRVSTEARITDNASCTFQ